MEVFSFFRRELGKRVRTYTRDYLLWCSGYEASQLFPPELAAKIDAFPDVIKPYGHSASSRNPPGLFSQAKGFRLSSSLRPREIFFESGQDQMLFGLPKVKYRPPSLLFRLSRCRSVQNIGFSGEQRDGRPRRRQRAQPLPDYPLEFVSVSDGFTGRRQRGN